MPSNSIPLLEVRGLRKRYARRRGLFAREWINALSDANLAVAERETVGIVGSSGSGKSTLVRCAALLEKPDSGEVMWSGAPISTATALAEFRRQAQLVFQDSATAFNPRFSAAEIVCEPLVVQGISTPRDRRERACELMREVGLSPEWADRRASEFSGGQRQRLAIARALALKPRLIFLDEALSGLDLSTQAQIANLLLELQQQRGLAYALVSHDMALVARLADRVAIMSAGKIVEQDATAAVLANPQHAETQKLLRTSGALAARVRSMAGGVR